MIKMKIITPDFLVMMVVGRSPGSAKSGCLVAMCCSSSGSPLKDFPHVAQVHRFTLDHIIIISFIFMIVMAMVIAAFTCIELTL